MGYFESLSPAKNSSGAYFDRIAAPTPQSVKEYNLGADTARAQKASEEANSFSGIVKNTASDFGSRAVTTAKDVYGALTTAPAPKSLDMQESLKAGWDTITSTITDTARRFTELHDTFSNPASTFTQKGAVTGEVALGLINNLFTGVTAPLNAARGLPVVGYFADGVSNLFSALGTGGADIASNALDGLPVSAKTKATVRPLVMEVGALVAQIAGGKLGGEGIAKVADKSKQILTTVQKDVQNVSTAVYQEPAPSGDYFNKVSTDTSLPEAKGVEPKFTRGSQATSIAELETQLEEALTHRSILQDSLVGHPGKELVKYQSTVTGGLPELSSTARSAFGRRGDAMGQDMLGQDVSGGGDAYILDQHLEDYRNLRDQSKGIDRSIAALRRDVAEARKLDKNPMLARDTSPEAISLDKVASESSLEGGDRLKATPGTGEVKTRTLAKGVEEAAVAKKLAKTFGDLPRYRSLNMRDQAQKSLELVRSDYNQARRVALGFEDAPDGILPESIFTALEQIAQTQGDVLTLLDLARSDLTVEATTMGQRIRALGERVEDTAVAKIQEVQKAREKSVQKKYGNVQAAKRKSINELKTAIRKNSPNKESWESFIDSIKC